jgi:hypothetical protein
MAHSILLLCVCVALNSVHSSHEHDGNESQPRNCNKLPIHKNWRTSTHGEKVEWAGAVQVRPPFSIQRVRPTLLSMSGNLQALEHTTRTTILARKAEGAGGERGTHSTDFLTCTQRWSTAHITHNAYPQVLHVGIFCRRMCLIPPLPPLRPLPYPTTRSRGRRPLGFPPCHGCLGQTCGSNRPTPYIRATRQCLRTRQCSRTRVSMGWVEQVTLLYVVGSSASYISTHRLRR